MNDEFNRLFEMNSYVPFSEIRVSAERECRRRIAREHADYEDVTLDEIYEQIALDYALDASALARLKELEQELELRFCTARRTGKQFFDLAVSQGKRVILCSDMYLPRQTVDTILQKNGYTYDEIYLSSELRVGKWTKHLFARVQEELSRSHTLFAYRR
jgi:predicted HAD superfamily hydrolase